MPNNVENYLTVEGSRSDMDAFFAKALGANSQFTFNAFVPMPNNVFCENLEDREQWAVNNWGTKRDAYEVTVTPPLVCFQTAVSFPGLALLAVSSQFPHLRFTDEWIEETLESAGRFVLKGGLILEENQELCGVWESKESQYIHQLNMKYKKDYYVSYLEKCIEGKGRESPYAFYLQLP
jgi:hypothetical protein